MISSVRHVGLVVRDLNKSLAFYCDLLGLQIWKRQVEKGEFIDKVVGIPGVVLEWAKLKATDDSLVELLQYHSHPDQNFLGMQSSNRLGCSHIAFTISNLDRLYQNLTEQGYFCKSPPQNSPDGKVKVLYCHDPDGIILEMVEEITSA